MDWLFFSMSYSDFKTSKMKKYSVYSTLAANLSVNSYSLLLKTKDLHDTNQPWKPG